MHSNWLCLQARNVLHKDAERACSVNFDMHTWLGNCWKKKKEKASVLSNWTSNSILDPFSLFTSPFFHHPHRILLSPMSFRKSIWWKQTQHRRNILIQTIYSLHNTPKENICLPGTGRKKKSCRCTDLNMETSQWLNGYYCNEHLLTALPAAKTSMLTGMLWVHANLDGSSLWLLKASWILSVLCMWAGSSEISSFMRFNHAWLVRASLCFCNHMKWIISRQLSGASHA